MATPQFGDPNPSLIYRDRPAAFGILEQNGQIAVVRVKKPEADAWIDLPGGAVDPGEDDVMAVVREFGEEAGLQIEAGALLGRADQFFINTNGQACNNRQALFVARFVAEAPDLKIEEDHTLAWMAPFEALVRLRHDSHAWAVARYLRSRSL